jgi:hypothetical protein
MHAKHDACLLPSPVAAPRAGAATELVVAELLVPRDPWPWLQGIQGVSMCGPNMFGRSSLGWSDGGCPWISDLFYIELHDATLATWFFQGLCRSIFIVGSLKTKPSLSCLGSQGECQSTDQQDVEQLFDPSCRKDAQWCYISLACLAAKW